MATVLTNTSQFECDESEGGLWMSAQEMASQLGWELKPEGFCQATSLACCAFVIMFSSKSSY